MGYSGGEVLSNQRSWSLPRTFYGSLKFLTTKIKTFQSTKRYKENTYRNANCDALRQPLTSLAEPAIQISHIYFMLQFCAGSPSCSTCHFSYDDFSCFHFILSFCFLSSLAHLHLHWISDADPIAGEAFPPACEKKGDHAFGSHRYPDLQ